MLLRILNTIGPVLDPGARAMLEGVGQVDDFRLSQGDLAGAIDEYDAAIIGLGFTFDREVLSRAGKLRVIATATTGLDHIDIEAAQRRGIEVLSLRGEEEFLNTITGTAELAFGMLLDLARRVPWAFEALKRYEWNREQFRGNSLSRKTLGIVGLGRLGRLMARQAAGFGMRVIFYDPYFVGSSLRLFGKVFSDVGAQEESGEGLTLLGSTEGGSVPPLADLPAAIAEKVDLAGLLHESDMISLHIHLSNETEGMFGEREFAEMKPGAYLVNTSRGKIVDERALLSALEQNKIAGYATDVLADELSFETAGFSSHPLVEYAKTHENLLIVPHIGGMTVESRTATDIFIATKLARYFKV